VRLPSRRPKIRFGDGNESAIATPGFRYGPRGSDEGGGSSLSITLTPIPAQSSWDLPQVAGVSIANAPEGLVLSVVSPNFAIRGHG
jgi:hypothetical protein